MSAGKVIWRVIAFILPILLVYGLFRQLYLSDAPAEFLPSWSQIYRAFSSAPDWSLLLKEDVRAIWAFYDAGVSTFNHASASVHDLVSFFEAFGKFFEGVWQFLQMFGSLFVLLWHAIEIPFKAVLWFFSVFAYPEAMGDIGKIQEILG